MFSEEHSDYYKAHFEPWMGNLSEVDQRLMRFHNEQRRASVHLLGPDVETVTTWVPMWELQREIEDRGGLLEISSPLGVPMPQTEKSSLRFRGADPGDVSSSCGQYLELLQKMVKDLCVTA